MDAFRDDSLPLLLQLRTALNYDCPELNLGTGKTELDNEASKWGVYSSGIKNVSDEVVKMAYQRLLGDFNKRIKRSQFHYNVWRALRGVFGNSNVIHSECLSLSGYSHDFQLLVNNSREPVKIPHKWQKKSVISIKGSIGISTESEKSKVSAECNITDMIKILDSEERISEDTSNVYNGITRKHSDLPGINLAFDWGKKFDRGPRNINPLVIEVNGPFHYTRNTHKPLGYTVIKERQTRQLGWKILSVSCL